MREKLYILVISSAGALLLCEIMARLILPEYAGESYSNRAFDLLLNSPIAVDASSDAYSQKFGFKLSSYQKVTHSGKEFRYTVQTNSLGFRTRERTPRKVGEYRVLLLGDSMFFGTGLQEAEIISTHLERLGAELPGAFLQLSTYNYSVPGYNTLQELLVARTHIQQVAPDHIVLGFFTANDVIPNALASVDNDENYVIRADKTAELRRELNRTIFLCLGSVICRAGMLAAYVPRLRYQIASRPEIIRESYRLLEKFRDLARDSGVKLTVVIAYPRDAVQGGLVHSWSRSREVGQLLSAFCASHGIESIDLLDFMRGKEARDRYFYQEDGHFNPVGSEVVAKAILQRAIRRHITIQ